MEDGWRFDGATARRDGPWRFGPIYACAIGIEIRDAIESDAEALQPPLLQLMREPSTAEQIRARLRRLRANTSCLRIRSARSIDLALRDFEL